MAMWHCPHCGTPQAETARCWVCRRSSTTCSTCRHFRTPVTAGLGWCGQDRARRPLRGDEIRGCWQAAAVAPAPSPPTPAPPPIRLRDFVPLDGTPAAAPLPEPQGLPPPVLADPAERGTLFELDA